jgi:hypothetical protein
MFNPALWWLFSSIVNFKPQTCSSTLWRDTTSLFLFCSWLSCKLNCSFSHRTLWIKLK